MSLAYGSMPEETDKEGRFVVDARDHVRKARAASLFNLCFPGSMDESCCAGGLSRFAG